MKWYQYRLRSVLLLMLLASAVLSWYGVKYRRQRERDRLLSRVMHCNGLVESDDRGNVKSIGFRSGDSTFSDELLAQLVVFDTLEELNLNHTRVSDDGLEHLSRLTHLRKLTLRNAEFTDKGLEQLGGIPSLEELHIERTQITDAGLRHAKSLPNLKTLVLRLDARLTGSGLSHLLECPNLQTLEIVGTTDTDVWLDELQRISAQARFRLALLDTQLSDAQLDTVGRVTSHMLIGTSRRPTQAGQAKRTGMEEKGDAR